MKKEIPVKIGNDEFVFYGDEEILEFFAEVMKTLSQKSRDYTGKNEDNFANFRRYMMVGVSPEQGIVTRMIDKISRISTIIRNGTNHVKDETIFDTLKDLIAYSALLAGYLKKEVLKNED